jgi:hypothetical protein
MKAFFSITGMIGTGWIRRGCTLKHDRKRSRTQRGNERTYPLAASIVTGGEFLECDHPRKAYHP